MLQASAISQSGDAHQTALALYEAGLFVAAHEHLVSALGPITANRAERRAELEHVLAALEREVTNGAGLEQFASFARGVLEPERLFAALHEALKTRPDLPSAHLTLAREYLVSENFSEAARVLEEACQRFPYHAELWLERSDLCGLRRDVEGRLAALRRAHQVEPENVQAARALASELEARKQFAEARAVCESAALRNPAHGGLKLLLAELQYAAGDRERAYAAVQRLCTIHPGFEAAWDTLDAWDREMGRTEGALAAARTLTEKRPDEARSWLVLANRLVEGGTLSEFEHAIERATELNPELVDAYDLAARMYARHGRWAQALEACDPPPLRASRPFLLRGRRAWVLAERGSLRDAIEELNSVMREVPDYYTGARWLCDFYERANEREAHAEAARRLAQLAPDSAPTHGYVGAALIDVGDRAGAKEHFWRALALSPGYAFGSSHVFDLHLEDGELEQARRALELLERAGSEPKAASIRAVRLAAAEGDAKELARAFAALLRLPEGNANLTRAACKAVAEKGLSSVMDAAFVDALRDEEIKTDALEAWADMTIEKPSPLRALEQVIRAPLAPAGAEAVSTLVTQFADTKPSRVRWGWFLFRNRSWLRKYDAVWGAVGYALVTMTMDRWARRWLADHAKRTAVAPWQIYNLASSLRRLGRDREAAEAHRAALTLQADHTSGRHRVWAALYAAIEGDLASARAHLDTEAADAEQSDVFAKGCAEVVLASEQLKGLRAYGAVVPLRFALARLIARAGIDLDRNYEFTRLLGRALRCIAARRPWLQAIWIRLTWGRP